MVPSESSWKVKNNLSFPKLSKDMEADIVIVGAGIAGIFSAYILSKAGLKVVVLEANKEILQNATLRTTAFITKIIDTSFDELVSILGKVKAEHIWQSGQDAIDTITEIIKTENIDCDFKSVSIYTYARSERQFNKLTKEYDALKNSGIKANIKKYGADENPEINFKRYGSLEIPGQAMFHPIKFAEALAKEAEKMGAKIFTDSEVMEVEGLSVNTKNFRVQAKDVLISTYSPLVKVGTRFRKAMYKSYVFELEIAKNLIPEGMYLDMDNPYHYFRIDNNEKFDRMIAGGEDHRADIKINPDKNFNALEKYIKEVLGDSEYKITRKWAGRILESVDGLPLVGEIKPHTFVSTAFSGNGMTYSAISSEIIRDLILHKKNPYIAVYDVNRGPSLRLIFAKGIYYIEEFFGGALKNFFLPKKEV